MTFVEFDHVRLHLVPQLGAKREQSLPLIEFFLDWHDIIHHVGRRHIHPSEQVDLALVSCDNLVYSNDLVCYERIVRSADKQCAIETGHVFSKPSDELGALTT